MKETLIIKYMDIGERKIPVVSSNLGFKDIIGALRVRFSIGRMKYMINPDLYAVGNPGQDSNVFVSANYKLSFDMLRSNLKNMDAWILVLDTKGINVWCAAGKGTFGTGELVNRIRSTELEKIVKHRRVIVPQLGATGVSYYRVMDLSGFSVTYGHVRAKDIPEFINNNMKTTDQMRLVKFGLIDRITLVPVELVGGSKYLIFFMAFVYIISGFGKGIYSTDNAFQFGSKAVINIFLVYIAGTLASPILLPWVPGRSFALKGAIMGAVFFLIACALQLTGADILQLSGWFLVYISVTSFIFMNFTGATTYTSLSGVKKEMKIAVPLQAGAFILSMVIGVVNQI